MNLVATLFALFAVMWLIAGSGRSVQDAGTQMSQQSNRLLALQRAEAALARTARSLRSADADVDIDGGEVQVETLASASDAELEELPLMLQRVTAVGEERGTRVRLQADYAVDGCESAHDEHCVARVRRIAWRQLSQE